MGEINIGLIGLGTVGTGVAKILLEQKSLLAGKLGFNLHIKRIADIDITTDRGITIPDGVLTTDIDDILNDPEISIVVELVGGIDFAKNIILKALSKGKHVVTANKALLAEHGPELYKAAQDNRVDLLFEASVAGGIPVIRSLKEGLAANRINYVCGILNGTCNYILTKMTEHGDEFKAVLREAQHLGFAEADPTLDVDAHDTAHKVAILVALSQGLTAGLSEIYTEGIRRITPLDIQFAKELGYCIKLLGIIKNHGQKIEARVHPTMVPEGHILSSVHGAFNALQIVGDNVGSILLYGLGAGMMPTASAVMSDILELARNIKSGVVGRVPELGFIPSFSEDKSIQPMDELKTAYYFRFTALDQPGVLSKISGILGENRISIESVIQKGREEGGAVPIVMLTHKAREADVRNALEKIDQLDVIPAATMLIRVEGREGPEFEDAEEWVRV